MDDPRYITTWQGSTLGPEHRESDWAAGRALPARHRASLHNEAALQERLADKPSSVHFLDRWLGILMPDPPGAGRVPSNGSATVAPNQPWTQDGTASVAPIPPFPETGTRVMPLDNRPAGSLTVRRSTYPLGIVLIPTGSEPSVSPAVLPIVASSGNQVSVTGDNYVEFPDGFVVWFLVR